MILTDTILTKFQNLIELLKSYSYVGVAFSGGIDSTLLLYAAHKSLGEDRVLALHNDSCLINSTFKDKVFKHFLETGLPERCFKKLEVHPLYWKEFIINSSDRCYFCKKRMYTGIRDFLLNEGQYRIVDGTNCDDLKQTRPGLRAIRELGVLTPYVECKLSKHEIRLLAKHFGLSNHDLSSNSCLATRLEPNSTITTDSLKLVEIAENYLEELGYFGTRVKPRDEFTIVQVQKKDLKRFVEHSNTLLIRHKFHSLGLKPVMLDVEGRE